MMSFESSPKERRTGQVFELMTSPELVSEIEWKFQLFSILLKAENPNWGGSESELAQETIVYFHERPLDSDIQNEWQSIIGELSEFSVDEESLYNLTLAYGHPERLKKVFEMIALHKPNISNPEKIQQKFFLLLDLFEKNLPDVLIEKFHTQLQQDKEKRIEAFREVKKRIEKLIDFFMPDSATTPVKKVNFIPTDPLWRINSGRNFSFGEEQVIASHIENTENQDHEFLHGVINPIVDKLALKLTKEQQEKISSMASETLKRDYGDGWYSLLCEELIRSYNDVFKHSGKTVTYEDFHQKISGLTEESFQKYLSESVALRQRCQAMGIHNAEELKQKSRKFFDAFEKNPLRELILKIYGDYEGRSDKTGVNFEKFLLENFTSRL